MTMFVRCFSLVALSDLFLVALFYWLYTQLLRFDKPIDTSNRRALASKSVLIPSLAAEADRVSTFGARESATSATEAVAPARSAADTTESGEEPWSPARFSASNSWSDFDRQLQSIQGWIRTARLERHEPLVDDALRYTKSCVESWCSALAAALERGSAPGEDGLIDNSTETVLAQLETTLTNLHSSPGEDSLDAKLNRLEREVRSLQKSRLSV